MNAEKQGCRYDTRPQKGDARMSDIPTYHKGQRNFGTGYDMMARIEELEGLQRFAVSDGQRLLRKCDIKGVCDTPDLCFEDADTVARCGPCASKLAAQAGVDVNFYTFSNPQAMRLARRITTLEAALDEIITEATSRNHAIYIARRARHGGEND